MPVPAEARRLDKAEIKQRYARHRRKRRPLLVAIRLRQLNRLFTDRAGGEVLPDTEDARRWIWIAAHHLAHLARDPRRSIPSWIALRAPWMSFGDANELVLEVVSKPRRWTAAALGWALKLTAADRKRLRLNTIAPYDVSPGERDKRRRKDAKARAEASRRRRGATTRAAYLAAVTKPKPWRALGMSRATWYRKGCPPAPS